jgi:hypothetical protein
MAVEGHAATVVVKELASHEDALQGMRSDEK